MTKSWHLVTVRGIDRDQKWHLVTVRVLTVTKSLHLVTVDKFYPWLKVKHIVMVYYLTVTNTFSYALYCDARSRFHKTATIGFGHGYIRFGDSWRPSPKILFLVGTNEKWIESKIRHKQNIFTNYLIRKMNITYLGYGDRWTIWQSNKRIG